MNPHITFTLVSLACAATFFTGWHLCRAVGPHPQPLWLAIAGSDPQLALSRMHRAGRILLGIALNIWVPLAVAYVFYILYQFVTE